jgi:8-oxo-dGTP pyrophosphatase MutT (NUDIX family)
VTAAVLVPVFSGERAEATIVFIRRASQLQRDPGHVAFPGGRVEPGEAPEAAALREAEEEIGLSRSDVEVHGLVDVVGRRSGEQIAAYLGLLNRRPVHMPNASEVDSVIEVPVARLLSDGVAWRERWLTGAEERSVEFFADPVTLQDDLIWGVSARILWRVLELVARPG